jgi:hypothetical protein
LGVRLFYPQITPISADYGGLSCCCAAIHAAGFFADWGCLCLNRLIRLILFYPQITPISADYF